MQTTSTSARKPRVHTPEQVHERLRAELPLWELRDGSIQRNYRTGGWKATAMVVGAVAHLAEAAWHHPDLEVSYASVRVKLSTHSAGGVTERDFELARKIEQVVDWQPAREPGSWLEGTPDEPHLVLVAHDAPPA